MNTYTPEQLAEVIRKHANWLRGEEGGERANLSYANLSYADLRFADLTGADLRFADLTYADLTRANLRGANLTDANLTLADLTDANLTLADLTDANLAYADLTGADLTRANLTDANLTRANLTYADLTGANLSDVQSYNGTIGNMAEIKSIQLDTWPVTYTATHMQIGCQNHELADWWEFNDDQISAMDSQALGWWTKAKPIIAAICAAYPATPQSKDA